MGTSSACIINAKKKANCVLSGVAQFAEKRNDMKNLALLDVGFMVLFVVFTCAGFAALGWLAFMIVMGVEPGPFEPAAVMSFIVAIVFYITGTVLHFLLIRRFPEYQEVTRRWILEQALEKLLKLDGPQ